MVLSGVPGFDVSFVERFCEVFGVDLLGVDETDEQGVVERIFFFL